MRHRHTTLCIINGGVQCKFVVLVFKQRSVSWDSETLRIPATAYKTKYSVSGQKIGSEVIRYTIVK